MYGRPGPSCLRAVIHRFFLLSPFRLSFAVLLLVESRCRSEWLRFTLVVDSTHSSWESELDVRRTFFLSECALFSLLKTIQLRKTSYKYKFEPIPTYFFDFDFLSRYDLSLALSWCRSVLEQAAEESAFSSCEVWGIIDPFTSLAVSCCGKEV